MNSKFASGKRNRELSGFVVPATIEATSDAEWVKASITSLQTQLGAAQALNAQLLSALIKAESLLSTIDITAMLQIKAAIAKASMDSSRLITATNK